MSNATRYQRRPTLTSALPYEPGANAFFVSVRGDDADEIAALWAGLAEGAEVVQPLAPAQWAPLHGMLRDRFGVTWALDVTAPQAGEAQAQA